MPDTIMTWCGRDVRDLTREELIEALRMMELSRRGLHAAFSAYREIQEIRAEHVMNGGGHSDCGLASLLR